jgi:hypothetical protein
MGIRNFFKGMGKGTDSVEDWLDHNHMAGGSKMRWFSNLLAGAASLIITSPLILIDFIRIYRSNKKFRKKVEEELKAAGADAETWLKDNPFIKGERELPPGYKLKL